MLCYNKPMSGVRFAPHRHCPKGPPTNDSGMKPRKNANFRIRQVTAQFLPATFVGVLLSVYWLARNPPHPRSACLIEYHDEDLDMFNQPTANDLRQERGEVINKMKRILDYAASHK